METTATTHDAAEALRQAGIALEAAKNRFRSAHRALLEASGMDSEEARRLAFDFPFAS